ncbi:unnamed protein product [Echinostoma caproni]|uniref:Uncharacterized protein n=1 Tax=Echinostoma caproni TaxID=27848 RepID=A0A183AL67_9TREM|nr:unnamed protein product [Echinostoma caproni]
MSLISKTTTAETAEQTLKTITYGGQRVTSQTTVTQNDNIESLNDENTPIQAQVFSLDPSMPIGNSGVRLVWKAYIQTPVRLTEADVWPIDKPEQFGSIAVDKPITFTMNKTVRDYRHMLPLLNEISDQRRRRDSSHASRLTTTRQYICGFRGRKAPRFLKTFPSKHPHFPPLQRSVQFEDFMKNFAVGNSSESSETITYNTENTSLSVGSTSEQWKNSDKQSESSDSERKIEKETKTSLVKRRAKRTSLSSIGSGATQSKSSVKVRKKSSRVRNNFPLLPFQSTVHRTMAALQSMRDQRDQSEFTDMVQGAMIHLNGGAFSDVDDVIPNADFSQMRQSHTSSQFGYSTAFHRPTVIDMADALTGMEILDAKIRDYDMQVPIKSDDLDRLRKLYQVTIMREPILRELLTSFRLDALPNYLRHLVRMGSLYRQVSQFERGMDERPSGRNPFEMKPLSHTDIALNDCENLWIEARILTAGLFVKWMRRIKPNPIYFQLSSTEVKEQLKIFGKRLRDNNTIPTSTVREDLHSAIAACAEIPEFMPILWENVDEWFDNLIGCLSSADRTVREQTCYVLAYLFTDIKLAEAIRNNSVIDIGYDVTTAVLHAIETNTASFMHFYCLLALMVEGCPTFSILNAIIDVGPHSNSTLLNYIWPRLIYYALKYWNSKQFLRDRVLLKTLNECIEKAYVRGISRKNAKLAQIQLSRRFKILTKPTTVWLDEWRKVEE